MGTTRPKEYVLVSNWVVYRHQGRMWTRRLWAKDLELHLRYLKSMTILCPVRDGAPPDAFVPLSMGIGDRVRFENIPEFLGRKDRIRRMPGFLWKLISVMPRVEIFHFTAAEHPFLWGILVPLIRHMTRIGVVALVESSFWRNARIRYVGAELAKVNEFGAKAAVSNSHAVFVTQPEYIGSLADPRNSNHVTPAVWTDEAVFVKEQELDKLLEIRRKELTTGLKIGFFGQLRPEKGPDLLVDAARRLSVKGVSFEVDIFGQGPSLEGLKKLAAGVPGIRFGGFLVYDDTFFQILRKYHVIVVANRSDELPRIVFDAFSQAVPVVASNTPGLEFVRNRENGMKFLRGDSDSLAQSLVEVAYDPDLLVRIAGNALHDAREYSHEGMHRKRAAVLAECFPGSEVIQAFA